MSYYVNPQSIYVSSSAAISAIQTAAAGWHDQSQANIQLVYAGTTSGSSLTANGRNEVFFRNTSGGGNVAETYSWWDANGRLTDADIVFYEGSYQFFAFSGCSGGIYVENVAIHELGHVLGLAHTSVPGATMAPSMTSFCDCTQLTLEADDISGIESLYPPVSGGGGGGGGGGGSTIAAPSQLTVGLGSLLPTSTLLLTWLDNSNNETGFRIERSSGGAFTQVAQVGPNIGLYLDLSLTPNTAYDYRVVAFNSTSTSAYSNIGSGRTASSSSTNTAPSVTLSAPADNASYPAGATISFAGAATDTQDGNMTASLLWTSSLSGSIGTGGAFSRTLTTGTHVITASVTDSGGLAASRQITVNVTGSAGYARHSPSQLSASTRDPPTTSIALAWSDNSTNESGFKIERSAGGAFTQIGQVGANVTTYLDTGLAPNTAYDYRVFAFNSSGNSSYSNIGSGRTAAGSATTNTAPTVTLSSPANNASFAEGVSITFTGSATDTQDGNLTGSLQWTSSLDGALGTGGSLTRSLSAGTHLITASVTDSGGMPASRQVTIVVTGTWHAADVPVAVVGRARAGVASYDHGAGVAG